LRIGGNDLMKLIGIRRPRDRTIYQTPIGYVIANLVTIFKPLALI
jgi:citrate lyase beta subunit